MKREEGGHVKNVSSSALLYLKLLTRITLRARSKKLHYITDSTYSMYFSSVPQDAINVQSIHVINRM